MQNIHDQYTNETGWVDIEYSDGWNTYYYKHYGMWLEEKLSELKKENETLRDLIPSDKICQCDDPTIGHDPNFCKRCYRTRI